MGWPSPAPLKPGILTMQTITKPILPARAPSRETRSPSAEPRDARRFRHLLDEAEAEAEAEAVEAAAQGALNPPPPPPPMLPRLSATAPLAASVVPPSLPARPDGGTGAAAHATSGATPTTSMVPTATMVLDAAALELRVSPSLGKLAALNGLVIQATWQGGAGFGLSLRPPAGALSERLKRAAPGLADALSAAFGVDVAVEVHDER